MAYRVRADGADGEGVEAGPGEHGGGVEDGGRTR